jgi:hypothetical protein
LTNDHSHHRKTTRGVPKVTELSKLKKTTAAKFMKLGANILWYLVIEIKQTNL